ncbi:translocation/assembly module TamB, partial [Flavobacteriales bacterium]|nr:translocation/assembly module TamB [Flavobacteriales bacterium]
VYATGEINIEGYQDEIDIVVNAKTEKGSNFTLPLYSSSEVELEDYVVFIDKDSTYNKEETIDLEGINLDINVEVTADAKLQLIFDEVYGDIISTTGYGNLSMTVDKFDQFNLTGKYTIDKGDYLFTLGLKRFENLINKKFEIANGSTINWYGDPYNADIDISAIYKLKTSLYEIMPQVTEATSDYKQRRDVNCIMLLTDNLMTPTIDFAIELPRANETERAVIANLMDTKQEMNKQVFSLLLLNRFLPTSNNTSNTDDGGRGNTGAVSTTASEILSNQLSNWLSKLSSDIDIGLNYRPGDNITSDEIAVALSTELLNDRLVISSNFGVSQGNEINQNENSLIGDVNVEYKLNEDGTFRVRVFSRTNEYDIINATQSQTTSGVGLYYKKEFNNWKEFITPKKKLKQRKAN